MATERELELEAVVAAQAERIVELESRVAELVARLGQDSGNSSAPPSRDRVDRRARRAADRAQAKADRETKGGPAAKPGKQPGAPGSTLQRRRPDRTVVHAPGCCSGCGAGLDRAPVVARATRQVLEVPEPAVSATDHVVERRRCGCGTETAGEFPPEATGPVCWGSRVKAIAAYLMARQHLPLERCAEALGTLFGAPVSEGTLARVLPEASGRLEPFMDRLARLIRDCQVIHADETSVRVGAGLGWVHTASTPGLTLLGYHPRRGIEAIIELGVLGGYRGTIVHDGLATYDRPELAAASHAQCGAHYAEPAIMRRRRAGALSWAGPGLRLSA